MWESFHSAGSFPQLIERLNKEAIEGETESAKVLSIQVEMPSGPDAEWSLVFLRRLATSLDTMS